MLNNTINTFKKTVEEIKTFAHITNIFTAVIMSAYLIFCCFIEVGYIGANIVLAVLTLTNLFVYLSTYKSRDKGVRKLRRSYNRMYKWVKLGMNALSLGTVIYTALTSPDAVGGAQLIFTPILIVIWVITAAADLISIYLEKKFEALKAALYQDFDPIISRVNAIGDFARGVFPGRRKTDGEPSEEREGLPGASDDGEREKVSVGAAVSSGISIVKSIFRRKKDEE